MKCYCCEKEDWHIRKDLNPKKEIGICKECGNIAFQIQPGEKEKLEQFYKTAYRQMPAVGNLITCTRKLGYIKILLSEYLKDKKGLICGDIGAATGYVCNWLRQIGHKATGAEMTPSFRRFSEHYYGIPLTEELEAKHKYDLISYYHVLEHIVDPAAELIKIREYLKDDGAVFISVPEWLYELTDLSAYGKLVIENYFHENHINCFTQQSFRNMLDRVGFEIVMVDREQYGLSVLVKKCPPKKVAPEKYENWQAINKKIDTIKLALQLFGQGKTLEACDAWPMFPEAKMRLIYDTYKKSPDRQAEEFDRLFQQFPNNITMLAGRAVWHYQYARFAEAKEDFIKVCSIKPHEDYYVYIGWCFERLGDPKEALKYMDLAQTINPQKWTECTNWICATCAKMPAWNERAKKEIEKKAYDMHKDKIKLVDKFMEDKPEGNNGDNKITGKPVEGMEQKSQGDKPGRLQEVKKADQRSRDLQTTPSV